MKTLELLIANAWCKVDADDKRNPPVIAHARAADPPYSDEWELAWPNGVGFAIVQHPEHGELCVMPRSFPWRFTTDA